MRIRKHASGNRYLSTTDGFWVRDFTNLCRPLDINHLTSKEDYSLILENEYTNISLNLPNIDSETIRYEKIVIVSDGYDFDKLHLILKNLPETVKILATNRSLAKWKAPRKIDHFVVNNPFQECVHQLPKHSYYPKCIVSTKTCTSFVKSYKKFAPVYKYVPVSEEEFAPFPHKSLYQIDDYRNPICASIGLSYHFGVKKLLLLCCDDSFAGERVGAQLLPNGLYTYPQHYIAQELIDANLYWLKNKEISVASLSHGPNYENATYITKEHIVTFFED